MKLLCSHFSFFFFYSYDFVMCNKIQTQSSIFNMGSEIIVIYVYTYIIHIFKALTLNKINIKRESMSDECNMY